MTHTTPGAKSPKDAPENGDGLTTPHSQLAETHSKYTTDFIAYCDRMVMGMARYCSIFEPLVLAALIVTVAVMAVWRAYA
jgi:hypothetical protein